MKIYTREEYLKLTGSSPTWMDDMVVFQEDFDVINNQDPTLLPSYLANIELSIKNLTNDSVPTVRWSDKKARISYLKQPFRLFNMLDAGGTHHRFSIYPYHKIIREKYDLKQTSLKTSTTIETRFVKHNYNHELPVMNCLMMYKSYIQKLILESMLSINTNAKKSIRKL